MRPITFEDAKEQIAWEEVGQRMQAVLRACKERKELRKAAEYKLWERHWRTRLSRTLRSWADSIELPEPP